MRIDREVLDLYRNKLGLTDEELAGQCDISDRTIRRVREEGQAKEETGMRLAGALGIPVELLTNGIQPPRPPLKVQGASGEFRRYSDVVIELDVPFKTMDTQAKEEKKTLLKKVIGGTSAIEIKKVQSGSTILSLRMTEADILRLLAAMMDQELDSLRITKVRIPDHSWIVVIIGTLIHGTGRKRPDQIDDVTHAELLDALEAAMNLRQQGCLICKSIKNIN